MNLARLIAIALIAGTLSLPTSAALKGSKLLQHCQGDTVNFMVCQGYVMGVVDATNSWKSVGDVDPGYCLPPGIQLQQLVQVAVAGLQASSTVLEEEASGLVIISLRAAFPCDNGEAPAGETPADAAS